jgi:hypothetical protein
MITGVTSVRSGERFGLLVVGSALKQLDDRGDSTLPILLRALADRVEEAAREVGDQHDA